MTIDYLMEFKKTISEYTPMVKTPWHLHDQVWVVCHMENIDLLLDVNFMERAMKEYRETPRMLLLQSYVKVIQSQWFGDTTPGLETVLGWEAEKLFPCKWASQCFQIAQEISGKWNAIRKKYWGSRDALVTIEDMQQYCDIVYRGSYKLRATVFQNATALNQTKTNETLYVIDILKIHTASLGYIIAHD